MRSTTTRTVRRSTTVLAAAGAALAITAGAASAHSCFVPMQSLNGPVAANWEALTAQDGAFFMLGYQAPCQGAVTAGYAALKAAKLPVGLKIYVGTNAAGEQTLAGGSSNPNLANGKGLENFEAGSQLPEQMVTTWVAGASAYPC